MDFEAVIGLEIHVQLNSPTKMFCDCPNRPEGRPNEYTCPICLWMPGAVPRFSRNVLEKAVLLCLGLNCEVQKRSAFDQKVYYYPDLPKGYQLSQFHRPLSKNGWLDIVGEDKKQKRLRIQKIHMEEDVARLVHETEGRTKISLVDFNRAGSPLVEIVTEPDMRSPHDAMEFLRMLRAQIRYVGSSDCSMEQGTMRVDANISIRPRGSKQMNTKVEVKNMNSIRHVGDAIAYEIKRQVSRIEAGETIVLHTRLWDPDKRLTAAMRGKFEGPCIPDPVVADVVIDDEWLGEMKSRLPEMPGHKRERFMEQHGLPREEATLLSSDPELAEYFEKVAGEGLPPRTVFQWIYTQLLPALKERGLNIGESPVSTARFGALLAMLEKDDLTTASARKVLSGLFDSEETPDQIVRQLSLEQISDTSTIEDLVQEVLSENPDAVESYRGGRTKAMGFLVGQVMQHSKGRANPKLIQDILMKKLNG